MLNYTAVFEYELKKMIYENIERLKDDLASGMGTQEIQQYREIVGKIAGLRLAIDLCEESELLANKRERNI